MIGLWNAIACHISEVTATPFDPKQQRSLGGGSINSAYLLADQHHSYFVKCNSAAQVEMFVAEWHGLQELTKPQAIRVPRPLCYGTHDSTAYMVLEYIPLKSSRSDTAIKLGQQLAQLHQFQASQFGWDRNNTIGSTPQANPWTDTWVDFYREHRLKFQVRLAKRRGFTGSWTQQAERLIDRLEIFFEAYQPQPSLLHGDLWGGNHGADDQGNPVIFDPAVYYGDRETDLAMTELFGGFPPSFYQAYNQSYPLDPGYRVRKPLYQLYHLLNHLNLFGGGYLGSVQGAIQECLKVLQ